MNLNEKQAEAVAHKTGPCIVIAPPGSGKTAVIVERTKALCEKGIHPRKILVVTFTKAAATQMKERFQRKMADKNAPVQFGTFHAIFFSVLRHAYHFNVNSIIKEEQKLQFFRDILKRYDLETEDEKDFISELQGEISLVKGEMMDLTHYYAKNCSEEVFRSIFSDYENMLHQKQLIDFEDMLVYCYKLFKERPDILKGWQGQFEYIMIDEFQDINHVQYEIVKMLAQPKNNLFIVGDDDQSIYRFRGAKPELMLNFPKDYPGAKEILLNINYRSRPLIVEGASKVISHNTRRYSKQIVANKKGGIPINIVEFPSAKEENKRIITEIKALQEQGLPLEEIAILFRTNTQPRVLIQALMQHNIPFRMKDSIPNIYDHFIGRDLQAYIRTALGNRERRLFLQLSNRPKRYINREAFNRPEFDFEQLRIYYEEKNWMLDRIDQWESDLKWIKKLSPYPAITYIRKGIGYNEFLEDYADYRRINIEDLNETIEEIHESSRPYDTFEEWFRHIEAYTQELKEQSVKNQTPKEGIILSTMHSAKGLEYGHVFILDANEGVTPYHKATLEADLEEERRMFYVAMTRAKEQLNIYYVKERFHKEAEPSRFVTDLMAP